MAHPGPESPKLFARDIVAYSDSELAQYLKDHRRHVTVQDPENLPEEFIQRLRDHARHASDEGPSRPVDLDQVAARLLQMPTHREDPIIDENDRDDDSHGSDRASTPVIDLEQERQWGIREETWSYNALLSAGGRPSYPLSVLEDIVENPGEYRDILSFWQTLESSGPDDFRVFSRQLYRWKDFQRLQKFARGGTLYDNWRGHWEESRKRPNFTDYPRKPTPPDVHEKNWEYWFGRLKEWHKDDEVIMVALYHLTWDSFVGQNAPGVNGRFALYAKAIKERLTKHGFTRTFQLDEDLARQDRLTTWVEYLAFEYYFYDMFALSKREQQFIRDEWQKLVDSKVLRPHDTEEFICSIEAGYQEINEEKRAKEAVDFAKSAVTLAQEATPNLQNQSGPGLHQLQAQLDAAEKEYASVKRRNHLINKEFVKKTKKLRIRREKAEQYAKLVRWILQQFPLIELELKDSNTTENCSSSRAHSDLHGGNRTDRASEKCPTGKRSDTGDNSTISDRKSRNASASQGKSALKRSRDMTEEEHPSKRTKHSNANRGDPYPRPYIPKDSSTTKNDSKATTTRKTSQPSGRHPTERRGQSPAFDDKKTSTVPSPPLRRSTRIAQREQLLQGAIDSSSDAAKPHLRSRKPRQPPAAQKSTKTPRAKNAMSKRQGTPKKNRKSRS
ncbi:hypothetical protein FQN50_007733 [Emmonsiellopsis sp. PD_5]|nr:hypothetical protein FQN50_007733 [Emmonsiellopsis sp. PD_5]